MPFCTRRCPYCTFYHVPHSSPLETGFIQAVIREIQCALSDLSGDIRLQTIYIGGGTPSVLSIESLDAIFATLHSMTQCRKSFEITFEINPEDVNKALLSYLKEKGVNRVSLGVQSMAPRTQRGLSRCPPDINDQAIRMTQDVFRNVNLDILLGVPGESSDELTASVEAMCAYQPQHFSVYCLEAGGDAAPEVKDFITRVDSDRSAEDYLYVCSVLKKHGYRHYEVSNFAQRGFESSHNWVYWTGGEYLGIGAGAHSFIDGRRYYNEPSLERYVSSVSETGRGIQIEDRIERSDLILEKMMLALRTDEGMPVAWVRSSADVVDSLVDEGLARISGRRLALTDRGFLLLDEILLRLSEGQGGSIWEA
ncbi:MAG: radical SAM family heme chaperone HemW [Candidatus Latescibacteria bacterium]|nr:radical SAM family heme chaperone HemW [Candidatus Latescibacterota bacterium]NIM22178.1 radical SAM family heme chaperone HemW [Candidatus Latescibacterota bacterium]NIO78382.1 radical SAM family heme chaperone HemW [Candidatus Latescibacterota bacterium]